MGRKRIHAEGLTDDEKYGKRDLFFHNSRPRETPNFYYQFYIKRERWKGMNKVRMIHLIKTRILSSEGYNGYRGEINDNQADETERILAKIIRLKKQS